jgi:serine/threonine protein kinase
VLDFWQARLWHMSDAIGAYSYFPDLVTSNVLSELKILNTSAPLEIKSYSSQTIQNLHSHRCIGLLQGIMRVFRNSPLSIRSERTISPSNISFVKQLYKSSGSVINLYTLHGFRLIGKTGTNDVKLLENVHESFIGIKSINSLVAKLPHFCYVFGSISNNADTPKTIFLEYIDGISMFQWLKSPQYNFKHLLTILVQINLALHVAQNSTGFVHNDLYPWNIMLSGYNSLYCAYSGTSLSAPKQVHYYINTRTILSVAPEIIPVIVDYGKSRAIVYEKDWGLIDHGFSNSYRHGQLVDTLSLLYSILNVLAYEKRLTSNEAQLLQFAKQIGIPDYDNIERWSRFGQLYDFTSAPRAPINKKNNEPITPKHFVDFILTTASPVHRPEVHKINLEYKKFEPVMEYGPNPLFVENFLKTGSRTNALHEVVKNINYSRFPPYNMFFTEIFKSLANRHLLWLNTEFNKPETPFWLQKQWNVVSKVFNVYSFTQYIQPQFAINPPKEIYFDENVSLETILKLKLVLDQQDWITIIDGIIDVYLFRVAPLNESYTNLCNINRFELFNKVASHCTLHKLSITEN